MARLQRRAFDDSDDVRVTGRGKVEVVELDDRLVAKMTWLPGWRWSVDVKPIAGTEYCQAHHFGVALEGVCRVQMADGVELEFRAGDVLDIPPGHDGWVVGDEPFVMVDFEAMRSFAKTDPNATRRSLTTLLMTDIVESTSRAVELGLGRWEEVVQKHNQRAERAIDQYSGRLVKTTGDGVIAMFDSTERAVRAGLAVNRAVADLGVEVRAAVQTGEVELSAGDVRGVVVHATARMMALAGGGEVVVSSTVRDLLDGTDLSLEDFGLHELRGLPGERHLYKVTG
jgi:class 3 adenylate cyclase